MTQTNSAKNVAIVILTLSAKDFYQKRGTTPQELRVTILAQRIGFKIVDFFADTDKGYKYFWPQRKMACDLLAYIELHKLQGCTLVLDQLSRFQNAIHPYLFQKMQESCKVISLDELYSEASRESE